MQKEEQRKLERAAAVEEGLSRGRLRTILALALPIMGGMTSQNILNLVDTAMVGVLGAPALAAVGMASFINFMSIAVVVGLATAVQAIAARRYGEGKHDETGVPLNGGLILAFVNGLPISILLIIAAPWIFMALIDDPAVVELGTPYLQIRLLAMVAIGMNFAFRGYWNAVNLSQLYLYTLLIMHAINIVLNYCLIFGEFGFPELGVTGAGIGTAVSTFVGTGIYFYLAITRAGGAGFLHRMPSARQMIDQLKLGVPSSIQQFFFAAGFTVLFWIIGQVGTDELAVASVLINITLVAILPGIGLGLAAATLVGQALGRNDTDDAHRWTWDVSKVSAVMMFALGVPMLLVPDILLMGFLHEPHLIDLGRAPLMLIGLGIAIDGVGLVMMHGLLGAGATSLVMAVSVGMQWILYLPIAWVLAVPLGFGLFEIWLAFMIYRLLQAVLFTGLWQKRDWVNIKV